jgi:mannose-6-phosphate isomerase-like protein (cupin superfamily)
MSGFVFTTELPGETRKWRRVVTGARDGKSIISTDENCPYQMGIEGVTGLAVTDLWRTYGGLPLDLGQEDPGAVPFPFGPPAAGTVLQILQWPPDKQWLGTEDPEAARNATMHRTDTFDYLIVLSGEIYVVMEEGEAKLCAGDVLIQRGTPHAWSNRSDQPCMMLVVMIDGAKPPAADSAERQ